MPDYESDAGLSSHLQKQKATIEQYKTEAGADTDDVNSIIHDCDNMGAIMDFCPLADEYKTSAFGIKKKLIRGEIGEPLGTLMTAPVFAPPFALVAGIEKRSRERDGRFKRSKTMTEAARLALDLAEDTQRPAPETIKPTLEVFSAQTGHEAALVISNRGKSDMWRALGRKMNSEKWGEVGSGTGKSGNITIAASTDGQPERMEIKIQLYKNNEPYGQPSDPQYVTFNP